MSGFSLGVRARAILLVLIATIPFAILIYRAAEKERVERHSQVSSQAAQLARLVARQHAHTIASARKVLAAAAADWDATLDEAACERRLEWLSRVAPVTSMSFVGADGVVRCSTLLGARGLSIADRGYFQDVLRTRQFAVSNLLRGRVNGRRIVVAAHPVGTPGASLEGMLVSGVALDWLPRVLADAGAPDDFEALVISGNGDLVERFGGAARADGPVERVMADAPLPSQRRNPDLVRIGLSSERAEGAASDTLRRGFSVLGGVFALALLVAWLGSSFFVVNPLRRLAQAAARLDAGDISARTGVPHGEHEIGRLARQLDVLAAHRQQVTRALRALSAGNRTLLREQSEPELLAAMCRVAVEHGHYDFALVAYKRDDEAQSIAIEAHAGEDRGALAVIRPTWANTARGQGTMGTTIRTGRTTVFQDIASAPGAAPWRDELLRRGFGSVASMPLRVEGEVIGTFTLFAAETDAFDGEELLLIEEMADDLAFGIGVCRARVRQQAIEREARRVATHDAVTDLANRSHFLGLLGPVLAECRARDETLAVVVVHVRNLPALIDALGYAPGMQVLREIGQRLRAHLPDEETLARVPQDDFAVLRRGADAAAAEALAHKLLAVFAAPVIVGDTEIDVQGHVGACLAPAHGEEPDLLLRRAVLASRDAVKHDAPFALYAGATERENPGRLALVADLRRAIESQAMELHFQPKVHLAFGHVVGSEALLRWTHGARGAISPAQFVPLAEQTGLVRQMSYLVLESALRQQRAWLDEGLRLPVAVNLSVRNLHDPALAARIEALLGRYGVPGELLHVEITEGALMEDPATARRVLERLRELGCRNYVDDFGTGYSSLSYLVTLPVHGLKIDRSFVVQMAARREARTVVASIITMAHQLGLQVVAEGVEREQERDALFALGCDEAQGFLIGRPVPAAEFGARYRG